MSVMPGGPVAHDPATTTSDSPPTKQIATGGAPARVLADALRGVRLQAAVFLRAEYSERWSYDSMPAFDTAQLLQPGADRVTLFHVVASGRCWISVDGGEVHWASAGDVIVIPYGDQHQMGGVEEAVAVPIETLIVAPPWGQLPIVRHGAGGSRTDLVCGYLYSEDPLFDPQLRAFPAVLVVRPPDGPARDWVRSSIDYALQQTGLSAQGRPELPPFLPELLARRGAPAAPRERTRGHHRLAGRPPRPGARARDGGHPHPAGAEVDRCGAGPGGAGLAVASSTNTSARHSGWRRSATSPGGACTSRASSSDRRKAASRGSRHKVGYDSEEAFSRAFKRCHGMAPIAWRRTTGQATVSQA